MRTGDEANEFILAAAPYEKQVYLTCLSFLHSREDAEDALQETMLKAFRSFRSFRKDAKIQTWLRRIAVNVCIDIVRKRKNVDSIDRLTEAGSEPGDPLPGPYEKLEQSERMRLLKGALDEISPQARTLILLRDVQGISYEEIAGILNQPVGTVKSGLNRARASLQKKLNAHADLFSRGTAKRKEGGNSK